jgi:putative DNA-invertase from lambdoid prophage Rac
LKVKIYARVSTDDKDQDPTRQIKPCLNYCEVHNHQIIEVITEHHSGDTDPFTRPEGKRLLEDGTEGIISFSMDRLTREHPTKVFSMLARLKDQGVKIVSVTEPAFNMESEFAEVLIFLMTWWNNYFLKKLKRDIRSGMDKARSEGKHIGRAKAKFNQYRAHQLLAEGKSQREVAKELGVGVATINRFKRVTGQNPGLYINNGAVPNPDGSGTEPEALHAEMREVRKE